MANPLMGEEAFNKIGVSENGEVMTMEGTINKSIILVSIVMLSAFGVWKYAELFLPYLIPIVLVAFIMAMVIIFVKKSAPYLSWVYAILEGIALGVISVTFEAAYPGIVIQAVALTFGVFAMMLALYKAKILQATPAFKKWVIIATGGIALVYIASLLWNLTGWYSVPYLHDAGPIWIGISVFIVWIAALNLIMDFDNIEQWAKAKLPKYMEWYVSFGLLITLIWLYLEILKLLSKLRR